MIKLGRVFWTCVAPTADKEEVEIFYKTVKKAMKQLKSQDIKIVMGDFNSR